MEDNIIPEGAWEPLEEPEEIVDLKQLAEMLVAAKDLADDLDSQLEAANKAKKEVEQKLLKALELSGLTSFKALGFNFYQQVQQGVKTPKTLEDKALLFEYLKSLGIYDELIGVNSQTLNSLFKSQEKEALEKGILEFTMPGVEKSEPYTILKMRKV